MSELNITPLLDLAFVLLVIFIITTTPPVNNKPVELPSASKNPKPPPKKAHYISIDALGAVWIDQNIVMMEDVQDKLIAMRMDNADLNVIVRADAKAKYGRVRAVLDACQGARLAKFEIATEVMKK